MIEYGDTVNLTCVIMTSIPLTDLRVVWTYNDAIIPNASSLFLTFSYTTADAVAEGGVYQCYVSTLDAEFTASSLSVVLLFGPFIIEGPQSVYTTNGSDVEFNCTATGYPVPYVDFYRVSSGNVSTIQDIIYSAIPLPDSAENSTLTTNTTEYIALTIDPVYYNDYGYYICVATFPLNSIHLVYDCCSNSTDEDASISLNQTAISDIATLAGKHLVLKLLSFIPFVLL